MARMGSLTKEQADKYVGHPTHPPGHEIADLLTRLAKVNGRKIKNSTEIGYAVVQLWLLAQKIVEGDKSSDLTGYAALPSLLNRLCGNAKWDAKWDASMRQREELLETVRLMQKK
jgi:hypothetical protein